MRRVVYGIGKDLVNSIQAHEFIGAIRTCQPGCATRKNSAISLDLTGSRARQMHVGLKCKR
jgi:hypothetical protein